MKVGDQASPISNNGGEILSPPTDINRTTSMMTTYVHGNCHCGLNEFRVAFPTKSLPISDAALCHCNSCRHCTGQMAAFHINIQGTPLRRTTDEGIDLRDLTMYRTTKMARLFCVSCAAHLFHQVGGDGEPPYWRVAAGALDKTEGIVEIGYHVYVASTFDGGLADHLQEVGGVKLLRYSQGPESDIVTLGWHRRSPEVKDEGQLKAYCHCGAIKFAITRPSPESFMPTAGYPDLLFPYNVTHFSILQNASDEKWWLRPVDTDKPTKYLAGHCMCTFCRLSSGFQIQSWAFIPLANIVQPYTSIPINLRVEEERPKGLKQYNSSPGRYREFCGICGATVFWWDLQRPDLIDVSVGLFDEAQNGARAEDWLEWHRGRVSFSEKALNAENAKGLLAGLKCK